MMVPAAAQQGPHADVDGELYECVGEFRYLGVQVDRQGRPATVAASLLTAARGSLAALCTHVGVQGWRTVWTRLVLFDVMVRTHLTFAAATWAPAYLRLGEMAPRGTPLGALSALHRRGLRVLAGVDIQVRVEVMLVALVRWPLELLLARPRGGTTAGLQSYRGSRVPHRWRSWQAGCELHLLRCTLPVKGWTLLLQWTPWRSSTGLGKGGCDLCAGIRAS
jgi:hypothetical protein